MTGLAVSHDNDHVLYGLPIRDGGLGVLNPTEMCNLYYNVTRSCTDVIVLALKGLQTYIIEEHITAVNKGQADLRRRKGLIFDDAFNDVIGTFGLQQQRTISKIRETLLLVVCSFNQEK